jgi:glutathione S-transferase
MASTATEQAAPRRRHALARRWAAVRGRAEAGMSTAEYAVGTVAACAFAAVLYRVVTGDSIVRGLTALVDSALATLS